MKKAIRSKKDGNIVRLAKKERLSAEKKKDAPRKHYGIENSLVSPLFLMI